MSNWDFIMGGEHCLLAWKTLRAQLTEDLSDAQYLQLVVDWWSRAPLQNRVLDYDQPQTWPDPWSLLYQGDFDSSSVSLGMLYTLSLAENPRWQPSELCLMLLKDPVRHQLQLALCVADTWLLGWEYHRIISWPHNRSSFLIQNRCHYYEDADPAITT
jgi:hypothetical protein